MSEREEIERTQGPATVASLVADLRRLGVEEGQLLLVHSSLSALGWVSGGAQAVVLALVQAVGAAGTIVVPSHSTQLSDPAGWKAPPVPPEWIGSIQASLPAFDPALTPTRGMGAIVDCFLGLPGRRRSAHPLSSFAAHGPLAERVTAEHPLESPLGEGSPLARLYELGAQILLLGVGHDSNTSLHLAEARASTTRARLERQGAPVFVDGVRRWLSFQSVASDSSDFGCLGAAFEAAEPSSVQRGRVGLAESRRCEQRALVDYAVGWLERER